MTYTTTTAVNYKTKAIRGAALVITGYGLSQVMRLGGNLVLTRLLVPEFFGLMALAQVFIKGLNLFSDIGLGPGVIYSPRGNESAFLNTAWTLQIIRGIVLWAFTLIIAIPVAKIYGNSLLSLVIPVVGLGCIISGFNATSIFTLNKDIQLGRLTIMDLAVQLVGLICVIVLAYAYRNVWALVFGGLIATSLKMIWSHFLDSRIRNRFMIEKAALKELLTFGKWIFVSTAMMFVATQADRLLLGKFFPLALFGVYSIAVIFAELPKQIVGQISSKVIFPLISKFSHLPRTELRQRILNKRKLVLIPLALLVALMTCFGDILISSLYDARYQQAGWMLPLLSLGMWPLLLCTTIDRSLYAIGKPKFPALGNFLKFVYMVTCLPFFYLVAGKFGAVLAVAMNDVPVYIIVNYGLKREKLSGLSQDAWTTLMLLGIIFIFLAIRYFTGMGFPGKALLYEP